MIFGCQSSIIHASVDIHIDIQPGKSMQGHSAMDIKKINIHEWISMFCGYQSSIIHAYNDIHLEIHWFLWMPMHGLAMDSRSRDNKERMYRQVSRVRWTIFVFLWYVYFGHILQRKFAVQVIAKVKKNFSIPVLEVQVGYIFTACNSKRSLPIRSISIKRRIKKKKYLYKI